MTTRMVLLICLSACGCVAKVQAPALVDLSGGQCPEETDLTTESYFCDAQGGISVCTEKVNGTAEPSLCNQATGSTHLCACDSLTKCLAYSDVNGYPVVGCEKETVTE
jgi:hypothetical protein